ncbi:MAG: polymerase alpha subunit, partial [Verrucomicrobia bacterium]|nr:polymerase alpha subunit [Verrucomicrobiota bacterium]
ATVNSFALYGFPESHAISFAHLAYASAYLKVHRAPEFYASLLNNQPMGFYSSATLIKDGERHGLKFRPVCVLLSGWDCKIEPDDSIRLGLRVVRGLSHAGALRILEACEGRAFDSLEDFKSRLRLGKEELRVLAEVGALNCLAEHRRAALWQVEKTMLEGDLFERAEQTPQASPLVPMTYPERIQADFGGMHLTTGKHPMALIRTQLGGICRACDLARCADGTYVRVAGNVICRQRPGTAKGFVFLSLEDETGISNVVVTPDLFETQRLLITEESFLQVEGKLQHVDNVIHVKARKVHRLPQEALVGSKSYDFH